MDPETDFSDDLEELPEVPVGGDDPFSAADLGPPLGDDDLPTKMGGGTPIWAWGALVALIAILGGIGAVLYQQVEDEEHRWDAYRAAQDEATDTADFLTRIRALLPNTQQEDVRIRILHKMGEYRDTASVTVITSQLGTGQASVRTAAARALAAIGSPGADAAKPELLRVLPSTSTSDRAAVVWALAVLGESAASDVIVEEFSSGRLQGQPDFDPIVISNVLGPERLSSNELLDHEETSVRTLTAAALAETASPDVIDPLSRMADFELQRDEPDEHVLRSIASGLGRAGDERAGAPLFRIMSAQPRMRTTVLESLRRTVGAPGIAALLASASDVEIQRELVGMLASSHDPRAADALAEQLESEDAAIKQDAAFGLAELGDARASVVLLELAQGLDLGVAREALAKLQRLGAEHAADGLVTMLDDERFLGRRANILRALGTTGATHVGSVIERALETDDVASAAAALADLDYDPAYDRMLRTIPRPRDVDFSQPLVSNETAFMNRTASVRALGRYGRPEAAEALMTIIEDPLDDRRLRQDAGMALGAVATEEILSQVIEKLQHSDLDEFAKRYYLAALWQRPSAQVASDLMALVTNPDTPPDVRRAASLAVGYSADPSLDARVLTMLGDETLQREAAFMVVLGGNEQNARALLTALGNNEPLQQLLLFQIRDDQSNAFNLVTQGSVASGELWRRLRTAQILNEGEGDNRHGYVWNQLITRLKAGWDGHDGMTPQQIRQELWNALRGDDPAKRRLVAEVLAAMDERGLLMAARDQGGDGSTEARNQLRRLNNPRSE